MKRLRYRTVLLLVWIGLIIGLVGWLEPVRLSLLAVFIVVAGLLPLLLSNDNRSRRWLAIIVPSLIFLVWMSFSGGFIGWKALINSLLGACVVAISSLLGFRVSQAVKEFESAVAQLTTGHSDIGREIDESWRSALYREVRRARNHQRPLTILAVSIEGSSIDTAYNKLVQEAQAAMINRLMLAGVSRILCERLEDCDIVAQDNEQFLVALPEVTPQDLPGLVTRLRRLVLEQVGVDLKVGAASLPQDGYTLEGLLEKASNEMQADVEITGLEVEHLSINQPSI